MIGERTGEAFELDEQLTMIGNKPKLGDGAPDFEPVYFDPVQETMQTVRPSDSAGTARPLRPSAR